MTKILIVEDNPANRKLVAGILTRAGYDVCEVASADEGIPLALAEPFDLIVMDIQLPGTDGITAAKLLQQNPISRDVPILAVTANAMRGDKERILESGIDGYVAKPISYRELLSAVSRLLGESSSAQEIQENAERE